MRYRENPNKALVNNVRGLMERNGGYCPCQVEKSEDTICPCKKFREGEGCCCNLYVPSKKQKACSWNMLRKNIALHKRQ